MSIIRFEQAAKNLNEADKFEQMSLRLQIVSSEFTKSPLLQMAAWDIWEQILDVTTYWAQKDYSQMLYDKTKKALDEFEELQNDKKLLDDTKKVLIEAIQRANLRTKES